MKKLKSIGVLSAAKMAAAIYGCIGLVLMPFFLIAALLGIPAAQQGGANVAIGVVGLVVLAIIFPIVYAGMGFVIGAVAAFIYNLVARRLGGIELEIE